MRPLTRPLFFMTCTFILTTGCRRDSLDVDVRGIDSGVVIERFDRELFGMDQDTIDRAINALYGKYGDFYDIFNVHVINIGQASARLYPSYLAMFLNDPTNREVYDYAERVFSSLQEENRKLAGGFDHYLYHYPDSIPPRVVGYVSRFNQGLFTVGHFIGVGLDQYLGSDCIYYEQMGIPRYVSRNKVPARIPWDVMLAWATQIYPYNDSLDNVLSRMIHQGMLFYFVEAMYPDASESEITGFTEDQVNWCGNNEKQMWTYLVEHKILFSSDQMDIRKLIDEAPYTSFYTTESPGKAAVWQGWQIVRAFARRHPGYSLDQVLSQRDYQEVLRLSRYNPKPRG